MTRLLYFSREYTVHDHRFLNALVKSNYQVFYLCLERKQHVLEERDLPDGVEKIDWAGGRRPFRWIHFPGLLADIQRVLDRVKPSLVLAGPLQTAALLVALSGYQPLISMSWGYDLLIDSERSSFWRWATRYVLSKSAAMLGDCDTIRKKAISYGMADERIVTFPWGIDLQQFSPNNTKPERETFALLSTRSWESIYGVDVLAQAFTLAACQQPCLRLTMLGNGSMKNRVLQIFKKAGVLDLVDFPGQISQIDLPCFYQKAALYICASHSDGTSISLLEALASGCPVIVSDIPGNREWITPGVNGWLFPDGDAQAMAQLILHAFENRQKLAEMSISARCVAEQRADWNRNFPQIFKLFQIVF